MTVTLIKAKRIGTVCDFFMLVKGMACLLLITSLLESHVGRIRVLPDLETTKDNLKSSPIDLQHASLATIEWQLSSVISGWTAVSVFKRRI